MTDDLRGEVERRMRDARHALRCVTFDRAVSVAVALVQEERAQTYRNCEAYLKGKTWVPDEAVRWFNERGRCAPPDKPEATPGGERE